MKIVHLKVFLFVLKQPLFASSVTNSLWLKRRKYQKGTLRIKAVITTEWRIAPLRKGQIT